MPGFPGNVVPWAILDAFNVRYAFPSVQRFASTGPLSAWHRAGCPANRRNGASQKTVTTDSGKVVLDIFRDRNGTFNPLPIGKYQRRFPPL